MYQHHNAAKRAKTSNFINIPIGPCHSQKITHIRLTYDARESDKDMRFIIYQVSLMFYMRFHWFTNQTDFDYYM